MQPNPFQGMLAEPGAQARSFRFKIGGIDCLAVSDGGIPVPRQLLEGTPAAPQPNEPGPPDLVLVPLACLAVQLPGVEGLTLIDTGFGPTPTRGGMTLPTAGHLIGSLALEGIAPADIRAVLISHIHPDHTDGLFNDDGTKVYPNATYHVGAEEHAFWSKPGLDLSEISTPPPLKQGMLAGASRLMRLAGDRLITFTAGEDVAPGIGTMPLPGHSPAQVGFIIADAGDTVLYTADAVAAPHENIQTPTVRSAFDMNPTLAAETRYGLLQTLAENGWRNFTPHFPFPAVGRVRKAGEGFTWQADS